MSAETLARLRALPVFPAIALVFSNFLPLIGVAWLGWDLYALMMLYWLENLAIGLYNVLRMALARPADWRQYPVKAVAIPFFLIHYGGFCLAHGLLVHAIFGGGPMNQPLRVSDMPLIIERLLNDRGILMGLAALILSHGVSFGTYYVHQGAFRTADLEQLLFAPYRRILLLHCALLIGGGIALAFNDAAWVLILLVFLKVTMDLVEHWREHLPRARNVKRRGWWRFK